MPARLSAYEATSLGELLPKSFKLSKEKSRRQAK
jgi:hypothetical protein